MAMSAGFQSSFLGNTSDADFQKSMQQAATQAARTQMMQEQADRTGLAVSIGGTTVLPSSTFTSGNGNNNSGGSSGSGGGSSSVNASTGDFMSTAKGAQDLAKDMAEFQLGINAKQSEQDYDFRNREATRTQQFGLENKSVDQKYGLENKAADFQNQYALQGQQIGGTQTLEETRQQAETNRLGSQLQNQKDMQNADFLNQTNQRSQAATLALSGFRR